MMTFWYYLDRLLCRRLPGQPPGGSQAGCPMKVGRRIGACAQPKGAEFGSCPAQLPPEAGHIILPEQLRRSTRANSPHANTYLTYPVLDPGQKTRPARHVGFDSRI